MRPFGRANCSEIVLPGADFREDFRVTCGLEAQVTAVEYDLQVIGKIATDSIFVQEKTDADAKTGDVVDA